MSDEEDDIVLSELADEDLVQQMHDDLYDGLTEEIVEGTQILLDRGWGAEDVLGKALVDGMTIVGIDFRDGILFVPEVLLAANAMKGGMAILRSENRHAALHGVGGEQYLRHKQDAIAEIDTDNGHAIDQRLTQHIFGSPAAVQQNLGALHDFFRQTVVQVIVHLLDKVLVREL